jgi:hypothetical protein
VDSVPVPLPNNGIWYYTAASSSTTGPDGTPGWIFIPSQADLWQVTGPCIFSITDVFITGDQFIVYVDGLPVLTTPAVPPNVLPEIIPDVPGAPVPFVDQAALNAAFIAPQYSHGSVAIGGGVHSVNIRDIAFPPGTDAAGFGIRSEAGATAVEPGTWGQVKTLFD